MRTDSTIKKYPKKYWLVPIATFIIAIVIQIFLQDVLYDKSIEVIIRLQETMNTTLKCKTGKDEDGKYPDCVIRAIIFYVFYMLTGNYFYFVFIGVIYNFVNVYKAFVLALSVYISNLISALMGLIYHAPRPFMVNYNVLPFIRIGEWGQPNTSLVVGIAFYLTLYNIIASHKPIEENLCARIAIGFFLTLYCAIVVLITFLSGSITFDQMIVSILLGITVFATMFFIFKVKVNDPLQFYGIVKIRFIYFFVLNLVMILFLAILYKYINYNEDKEFYSKHLEKQFERFNNNYIDKNFSEAFKLSEATFTSALCFISNIIALIALKIELIITYDKEYPIWKKENFNDKSLQQSVNFSLISEYKYSASTQWNHTGFMKCLLRLIICLGLSLAPLLLYLIPKMETIPDFIKFTLFSFLIYCYYSFSIFYLFKKIYLFFGLNNKIVSVNSLDDN